MQVATGAMQQRCYAPSRISACVKVSRLRSLPPPARNQVALDARRARNPDRVRGDATARRGSAALSPRLPAGPTVMGDRRSSVRARRSGSSRNARLVGVTLDSCIITADCRLRTLAQRSAMSDAASSARASASASSRASGVRSKRTISSGGQWSVTGSPSRRVVIATGLPNGSRSGYLAQTSSYPREAQWMSSTSSTHGWAPAARSMIRTAPETSHRDAPWRPSLRTGCPAAGRS